MENIRAEELIAAYLSGNLSTREREALMAWIADHPDHQAFFDKAVGLWSASGQYQMPDFQAGKARSWAVVERRLEGPVEAIRPAEPRVRRRYLTIRRLAVAATATLLLAAGLWWWMNASASPTTMQLATAVGERQEHALPDGSRVWLNENSTLAYEGTAEYRRLELTGEAFFEVATDSLRPFSVKAGEAVTTVLGTSFNLRAYPDEETVEVTVATGRVALASEAEETSTAPIELAAGQTGLLDREAKQVSTAEAPRANADAWKSGRLAFQEVKLRQVALELERYFDRHIVVSDERLWDCTYIGTFEQPKLDDVLAAMAFSLALDIQEKGDTVLLSGAGCQD